MADMEDPAGVGAPVAVHRVLDCRPRHQLRVDRRLQHPVVEKARRAIGVAVHRDQPHHARRRVERLGEPARVAGDFFAAKGEGCALDMPPLSRAMGRRTKEGSDGLSK